MFDATGDSRIRVMRRDDKTMKFVMHGYLPAESTEEDVALQWGGGHYRCQKIVKDSQGASVIDSSREFDLPGAYKPVTGEMPGIRPPVAPDVPPVNAGAPLYQQPHSASTGSAGEVLNAAMVSTVVDLLKMGREVAATRPDPNAGLAAILEQMREDRAIMLKMIEKMGQQQQGPTRAELLAEMETMKRLVGGGENSSDQLDKLVGAIQKLRDVSEEFSPKPTDTDPLSFVPDVLKVLSNEQALRAQQRRPAAPVARPSIPPAQPASTPPQPKEEPVMTDMPLWQQVLRAEGPRLLNAAKRGHNPALVAGVAYDFAPENIKDALAEFFDADVGDITKAIVENVPGIEEYPEWLADFIEAAGVTIFGDDEEPAPGTEPPPSATVEETVPDAPPIH